MFTKKPDCFFEFHKQNEKKTALERNEVRGFFPKKYKLVLVVFLSLGVLITGTIYVILFRVTFNFLHLILGHISVVAIIQNLGDPAY
jgi:hypothetical protein